MSTPDPQTPPLGSIDTPADLGRMVRARRQALGLTQADLGALCGVGTRFVSELENGKATVRLGLVLQVCAGLGLVLEARPRGWAGSERR